uniref:uncharacterized protein isoform X2 n=1 Tax=Semicossyphus pulcher TaxID=241346 RepID=UPI0037E8A536
MTRPMDYILDSSVEGGRGQHSQESGEAGLSSTLKHKFMESYSEIALPVVETGSRVKPIPKVKLDVTEDTLMGKLLSKPPPAETNVSNPSNQAEIEINTSKQASPMVLREKSLGKETVKVSTSVTAILDGKPDEEVDCGNSNKMEPKMNARRSPTKPRGPPRVPPKRRHGRKPVKRAAGMNKKWYLLFLMAVNHLPVSEGSPAPVKCFSCMDPKRCPNLTTIYTKEDHPLYSRPANESFSACSNRSIPAGNNTCDVCNNTTLLIILCPEDVGRLEVEDNSGAQIENISSVDCTRSLYSGVMKRIAHYGSLTAVALVVIVLVPAAVLIYKRHQN